MTLRTSNETLDYLKALNQDYEALHTAKEDAFWTAYMGLRADGDVAREEFATHEKALMGWLQDPNRLSVARGHLEKAGASSDTLNEAERTALNGWVHTLQAHAIDSAEARALAAELIDLEAKLAKSRGEMKLGYTDPVSGEFEECGLVKLSTTLRMEADEAMRRAAWQGLRSIENYVLDNGFIEVVKMRNRLGRMLGGEDYYDWKVKSVEGMSKADIFSLLDELEEKTRDAGRRGIDELRKTHGEDEVVPWSVQFMISGDVAAAQDPYFPFAQALERWGRSFAALHIDYAGATLVLDLLDRKGKYENGFMHGPVPAWRDGEERRPARIQFTANAIPGMVGSGNRATATLFHEGGHAAHFSNIDMPAPCFAQEFAPTSVAFAETQSMFLDSLLEDADWQLRYAKTEEGEPMPMELIERGIRAKQPSAAWSVRAMMVVPYAERAIYEIPDDELTPERILETMREVESRMLFLAEGSARPTLSVPHLLAGESSAYYHGYVLAEMGVQQTRRFFVQRDGHLVDNPKIGPDLCTNYWRPGNSRTFMEFIEDLTKTPLSADSMAENVNRSAESAIKTAKEQVARLPSIPEFAGDVNLGATVTLVHGNEIIASTADLSFSEMCATYAAWVKEQASAS